MPNCVTMLHDDAHLQITSLLVERIRTATAFTNNDCCLRHRRRAQEAKAGFIRRGIKTKWNQRSLELRGLSFIQGDPFFSVPLLPVDPKPTHQWRWAFWKTTRIWVTWGRHSGKLWNKIYTFMSFSSNQYSLAQRSWWFFSPLKEKTKVIGP